ncbi:MAG: GNAT family N-acetyltransferase [Spirochaetaceae bacterium]|nr:MAG: GNAT family N-acetyltransferase [Spirochaetaceae bacterium]
MSERADRRRSAASAASPLHLRAPARRIRRVVGRAIRPDVPAGKSARDRVDGHRSDFVARRAPAGYPGRLDSRSGVSTPVLRFLSGSRAVSVCASVRIGTRADEAGVETAPAYRRQGHAVNAVSGWAEAVLAIGKIPLYSTSWTNAASQAAAHRTGFEPFGAEYTIS